MSRAIQEYYNQIVQAVRDGVLPSYRKDVDDKGAFLGSTCYYRHPDGKHRCVVGIRIPDDLYEPSMETVPVARLPDDVLKKIVPEGMDVTDLNRLQNDHDQSAGYPPYLFAQYFLTDVNSMSIFADVEQVNPLEVARELAACADGQPVSSEGLPYPV